jgi:hypothetical protein
MFLYYFDVMILKINFQKQKILSQYILKNNLLHNNVIASILAHVPQRVNNNFFSNVKILELG